MLQSSLQLGTFQLRTAWWCQQRQDYLPSVRLLALVFSPPQHLLPVLRSHCSSLGFGCHFLLLIQVSVPVLSATWAGLGFPCYPIFISWWGTCSYTFFSGSADLCLSSRHRCLWAQCQFRAEISRGFELAPSFNWKWPGSDELPDNIAKLSFPPPPAPPGCESVGVWEGGSCHCEELFRRGGITHFLVYWWGSALCIATPRMYF